MLWARIIHWKSTLPSSPPSSAVGTYWNEYWIRNKITFILTSLWLIYYKNIVGKPVLSDESFQKGVLKNYTKMQTRED